LIPSFLDPEDIRKLSIGAIWNFAKGTGLLLVQNMAHKGPVLRPRCIGPRRAWTQIPFNSIQHVKEFTDMQTKPVWNWTKILQYQIIS